MPATTIKECHGCGKFRVMPKPASPDEIPACFLCRTEGERGRVYDSFSRKYVVIGSGHRYVDGFDDDTHDSGRRSDAAGRL